MLLILGLILIVFSIVAGYFTGHRNFESGLANASSWLTMASFLLVLRLTDTVQKMRFEGRHKKEIAHYSAELSVYCTELRAFMENYTASVQSIDERLGSLDGELNRLGEVLYWSERRIIKPVQESILTYQKSRTKDNVVNVLRCLSSLHKRIQGWERDSG